MSSYDAELCRVARELVATGKGILAADEPVEYMDKSLGEAGLKNTPENRRLYRQLLFTSDDSLADHISGVILHPETVSQTTTDDNKTPFVEVLKSKGIIAGVNVDKGLVPLHKTNDETTTQGLDDLGVRCREFKAKGCRFAKWRCALKITDRNTPSPLAVSENAKILARYASICQANGLVPIVEPEIQLEGDHDLKRASDVAEIVFTTVYKALHDYRVLLEGTLLKPSMVTQGSSCPTKYKPTEIAMATVNVLFRTVPVAVPGIGFLSGGQNADQATENLRAINEYATVVGKKPWALTFIFGRALQGDVPKIWAGKSGANSKAAQRELINRAKVNGEATLIAAANDSKM